MTNEEKILAILEKHGEMLAEMKAAQDEMKAAQDRMQTAQDRMQTAQDRMQTAQDEMRGDISTMQETLTRVAVTQEGVVLPKLQLLYEGHETIIAAMDNFAPKDRVEALESDVSMLKDVIKLMRKEINELKQAQ